MPPRVGLSQREYVPYWNWLIHVENSPCSIESQDTHNGEKALEYERDETWRAGFHYLKFKKKGGGGECEGDYKHSRQKTEKQRTKGLQILSPGMSGGKADTAPQPGQDNYLRSGHFLLFFLLLCVFCGDMTSQTHICMLRKYLQRHPYSRLTCNCCSEKEENVFLFLSPFSELFADFLCSWSAVGNQD